MRAKQLVGVVVVMLLLIGALLLINGVASLGAAAPADQANDTADDVAPNGEHVDSVGPRNGLPQQVPDHVHDVHETIETFLTGEIDRLGEALSELLSADEPADEP